MGGEVDTFVQIRQRCMAYRNIDTRMQDQTFRAALDALPPEVVREIQNLALKGEYSNMMTVYDRARPLKLLCMYELKALAAKNNIYNYPRATRHDLIQALAKKGIK